MAGRSRRAKEDQQLSLSAAESKAKKRQPGEFNVWLTPSLKKRIDEAKDQLEEKLGFVPESYTAIVKHLVHGALSQLEAARTEKPPAPPPKLL